MKKKKKNSQDTQAENENDGDFGLLRHLDVPQHRDGEQSLLLLVTNVVQSSRATYVEPVRNNGEDTDGIGGVDNVLATGAATL